MNFKQFVLRNTIRNKHLYLAYFLSTLFSVLVFFTFAVFAHHPVFSNGLQKAVGTGMTVAAVIIYAFAFFFVMYSMDVFLQSRKKEFGLLMMQGMSPKQLRRMVFIENIVIGLAATVAGTISGLLFSNIILWFSQKIIKVSLPFYFPLTAILLTLLAFSLLFLAISFFIQFRLPRLQVQELLKGEDLGKGALKSSKVKAVLAIILIVGGYIAALLAPGAAVFLALVPVVIVVVIGTRFLFNELSVRLIQGLKSKQERFWKKTNMVVFSDLAFRMKDNARSFFLVAIISTVAFSAIGTLYGFRQIILKQVNNSIADFSYIGDPIKGEQESRSIEQIFGEEQIQSKKTKIAYLESLETEPDFVAISQSSYQELSKELGLVAISTKEDGVLLVSQNQPVQRTSFDSFELGNQKINIKKEIMKKPVNISYKPTLVLSNENYEQLAQSHGESHLLIWQTPETSYEQQVAIGKKLGDDSGIYSRDYQKQEMTDMYAPILFVGLFIGIVFFLSAGSFLYFRLYSDVETDISKFKMVYKIGLTKKEMKKMIYQQVGILFFTPITVSVIHGAVALTAMYHMFGLGLQVDAWVVLGTFILIQVIYYLVARFFYFKKVYQSVVEY